MKHSSEALIEKGNNMKFDSLTMYAVLACLAASTSLAADIKVGAAGGLTGPVAELAAAVQSARDLAAKQINEQGGLLKGDRLRLVTADSACDAKAAVDAGNKLVNVEQVVSIVGPTCSGETLGIAQAVTIDAGVMVITDSATSPALSALDDNDTVFRTVASDATQGKAMADLLKQASILDVAVITANDDYNTAIAKVFEKEFVAVGGKLTANLIVEPQKASYRSDLASLSNGHSRTLVVFLYYNSGGITVIKNSLEAGLFDTFFGAGGMANQVVVDQVGADNLKGHLFVATPGSKSDDPSYKAFTDLAKAASIDPTAAYLANGFDSVFLTALAIEKAGSADRDLLTKALREIAGPEGEVVRPGEWSKAKKLIAAGKKINYEGASGSLDFDKNGDVDGAFGVSTVNADGKIEMSLIK